MKTKKGERESLWKRAKDSVANIIGHRPITGSSAVKSPEDRAAFDAKVEQWEENVDSYNEKTLAEILTLQAKAGSGIVAALGALPERGEVFPLIYAEAITQRKMKLEQAIAAQGSAPALVPIAKIPQVVSPVPADQRPAPSPVTAESIGKAVIMTTTAQDPKIRQPAKAALATITAAAKQMSRPCFAFLTGLELARISAEFDALGVLSAKSHQLYAYRRSQFCQANKMTPEVAFGIPNAPLPAIIETATEKRDRESALKKADATALENLAGYDRQIAAFADNPEVAASWTERKAKAASAWAAERSRLSVPAHQRP